MLVFKVIFGGSLKIFLQIKLGEDAPRLNSRWQICFLAVKNVVTFSVKICMPIFPGQDWQNICHQKSTTFFTPKIAKLHHLEFLGPLSCKKKAFKVKITLKRFSGYTSWCRFSVQKLPGSHSRRIGPSGPNPLRSPSFGPDFDLISVRSWYAHGWELRNIYHHHPESKIRKSSGANSGSIHPYGRYGNAVKTVYHSDSLACQGHPREEGHYGGGRYFHVPYLEMSILCLF